MEKKKLWEWMKLFEEGVELESYDDHGEWEIIESVSELIFAFKHFENIRIKPQPKEVVLGGAFINDCWSFADWESDSDTHKITFKVDENNKPILDTVKMEEI